MTKSKLKLLVVKLREKKKKKKLHQIRFQLRKIEFRYGEMGSY